MYARNHTADVLKGIAVLFMIQIHVIELFSGDGFFENHLTGAKVFYFLGGAPVAPVFMVLFGYYSFTSGKTKGQLIFRGLKIFGLGMILNLTLNANLIISVITGRINVDIWPYIFGVDILQFAGLSLVIIATTKKLLEKNPLLVSIIIILVAISGKLMTDLTPANTTLKYISAFFYGSTDWSYFPLAPWLAYPLTSIVLLQLQKNYDLNVLFLKKMKQLLGILCIPFFILTIQYAINSSFSLPSYYHHGILFYIWTICFLVFYYLLVYELNKNIGESLIFRYLKWLGQNVTLMYVIQWIIIGNMATEIYRSILNPIHLIGIFVSILIVSSILAYCVLILKKRYLKIS